MSQPSHVPATREEAVAADRADPLAAYRDEFILSPGGPIYLDGNSLGRPPRAASAVLSALLDDWAHQLVGGWDHWADLPATIGDQIGQLVGATAGQIVVSDSTTINLYKLAVAALDARPGRSLIVSDAHDFPTVRYVLQGLAAREGRSLELVGGDPVNGIEAAEVEALLKGHMDDVALLCLSGVNYRSGAVADMARLNEAAHRAGALALWDLSHAAGAVPVHLDGSGADLAVGCGYKYLNGGPGAPAWLYVAAALQASLRQPVWGWWSQQSPFAMGRDYEPVPGMGRFLPGTPAVLGMVALSAGIALLLDAGLPRLWDKTHQLVQLVAARSEARLMPLGATIASPDDPARRGGHLAVAHEHAWNATRLLIDRGLVVPDFRPPNVLRLAPAALYTRFVDVWDAVERLATVLADPAVRAPAPWRAIT